MARRATAPHTIAGLLLVVLCLLSGCFTPFWQKEEAIPESFMFFGVPTSGRLGPTDTLDGSKNVAFDGCFLVDVEDPRDRGRVVADGYLDPISRIVVRMEDFWGPNETRGGGIGVNMPAVGELPRGVQVLPEVPTVVAGWGNGTIELNGIYLDDVFSGEYNFTSHFLVTDDGFVDDASGAIRNRDGGAFSLADPGNVATYPGDWEAHLVVHSHQTGDFEQRVVYRNRDDSNGLGLIVSDESYTQEEFFVVGWLGGTGIFDITVNGTALLEAAQTSLTFRVFDPSTAEIANTTIAPAGTGAVTETLEFPTARLGTYTFTIEGPAHAASYRVNATLRAPESYQLHFFWEDKEETKAVKLFDECTRSKNAGVPVSGNSNIARPPGLDVRIVAFGVLGALVAVLLVVKLVVDSRKIDEFRAKFGKK
jgi:hypothetical protein